MLLSVSFLSSLLVISFFQVPSSDHKYNLSFNNARWIPIVKLKQEPPQTDYSPVICSSPMAVGVRYQQKYLKRRYSYGCNHLGSYNPAVITNLEAHMIYGNLDQQQVNTEKNRSKKNRPGSTQITDFFSKASFAGKLSISVLTSMQFFKKRHRHLQGPCPVSCIRILPVAKKVRQVWIVNNIK